MGGRLSPWGEYGHVGSISKFAENALQLLDPRHSLGIGLWVDGGSQYRYRERRGTKIKVGSHELGL